MHRLFVAIDLPKPVKERLAHLCYGLPDTRWSTERQLHLTVRFIGEVEGSHLLDIQDALRTVQADEFELMLMGTGHFPMRGKPKSIWTGADGGDGLNILKHRIDNALEDAGCRRDQRKFHPHVTLARLGATAPKKVAGYMSQNASFTVPPFRITTFHLFESSLAQRGPIYRVLTSYSLILKDKS